MQIEDFNSASPGEAAELVGVWAAVPRWIEAVVAARPYANVDSVETFAEWAAQDWNESDLDEALSHHPRIGQKVSGDGAEASASRREQASMGAASDETVQAMALANIAYERRFGRVFLIRAAGRSPEEMLAEARRRIANDPSAEVGEALEQLKQIALLRLRSAFDEEPA